MFSDYTPRSMPDSEPSHRFAATPAPLSASSPPSPSALIPPSLFPGTLFGAPLSTIPELTSSLSSTSKPSDTSHGTPLHRNLPKFPLVPPLNVRDLPVATMTAQGSSMTGTSQAPQTPHSACTAAPSPTLSLKDLKARLQSPAEEPKGTEETWQAALRGGFLSFSSN